MLCQGPSSKLTEIRTSGVECGFFLMLPNDTNIQLELLTVGLREPALVQFMWERKKKRRQIFQGKKWDKNQ